MLILTRQVGGSIIIDTEAGEIKVQVLSTRGSQVRLGVEASKDIPVHREEIWEKIKKDRAEVQ